MVVEVVRADRVRLQLLSKIYVLANAEVVNLFWYLIFWRSLQQVLLNGSLRQFHTTLPSVAENCLALVRN